MAEDLELVEIVEECWWYVEGAGHGGHFFQGEWALRRRDQYGFGTVNEFFGSREECEVYLAARGLGIGRELSRGRYGVRWEVEEVS